MQLNTEHFSKCVDLLQSSLEHLKKAERKSMEYDIFRNATIKSFELALETAGKLLRKALKSYTANPRTIDELTYKDVLRNAAKHGLIKSDAVDHWFKYRDNRNNVAHDYGEAFAEETLNLLPEFLVDARILEKVLQEKLGNKNA